MSEPKIDFVAIHPHSDEAIELIDCLDDELRALYPDNRELYDRQNLLASNTRFVVLRVDNITVGCGGYRDISTSSVEIKRMYVQSTARGRGFGVAILSELERRAVAEGFRYAQLETGIKQIAAIALYERAGYDRVSNYQPYDNNPDSICFKKALV